MFKVDINDGPTLSCDRPVIDVGEFWMGPSWEHYIEVQNHTSGVVVVEIKPAVFGSIVIQPLFVGPSSTNYRSYSINSKKLRGKFEKGYTLRLVPQRDFCE